MRKDPKTKFVGVGIDAGIFKSILEFGVDCMSYVQVL